MDIVVLTSLLKALAVSLLIPSASASPLANQLATIKHLLGRDKFEWTAFGDSYSSGVGAGDYISNSYRCLRYTQAYPILINGDGRLPGGDHEFHNAVCSGSKTEDVEAYQFYDKDEWAKPNAQYGTRPRFGEPTIGTLSIGGNDIDFPGIIFNCILEYTGLGFISKPRKCSEQKDLTWELLRSPDLPNKIDNTIKKIVKKAQESPAGNQFMLYVTGFPRFFDETTKECDSKTFARNANPNPDGKEHQLMTQEVRKEYNSMSVQLNKAIEEAVARNADTGVKWIPIDGLMDGHRFCEPGIEEPDQKNPNLWLFHYPYNEKPDKALDEKLQRAYDNVTAGKDIDAVFPRYIDLQNAVFDALEIEGDDPHGDGFWDDLWNGVGKRVKVFHPQPTLHMAIRDLVLGAYIRDLGPEAVPTSPAEDENACHGISGDYWVMSRDIAVDNVKSFCAQTSKMETYNKGSVNELSLSIRKLGDSSKTPTDDPDCLGRFRDGVIDGCDGADPVNNPHNYKFGSTLTTADGWEYKLTPLSKQVNEVSCDVSYKFFFNHIEIRGKNLPDAKLGVNGEGLRKELSGCGALTKWNFERTPDDVKFQWYASCQLPVGVKNCVGRAVQSAGGAGIGNCHGPGKRGLAIEARRPFGIDDWPGYSDEDRHVFGESSADETSSIDQWPGYSDAGSYTFKNPTTG